MIFPSHAHHSQAYLSPTVVLLVRLRQKGLEAEGGGDGDRQKSLITAVQVLAHLHSMATPLVWLADKMNSSIDRCASLCANRGLELMEGLTKWWRKRGGQEEERWHHVVSHCLCCYTCSTLHTAWKQRGEVRRDRLTCCTSTSWHQLTSVVLVELVSVGWNAPTRGANWTYTTRCENGGVQEGWFRGSEAHRRSKDGEQAW